MKQENRLTGNFGENLAATFLAKKGFEIVERNFSTRFGEIDIIVRKDGVLVFVEVKTKKGDDFGTPEEMVGRGKVFRVKRMAEVYLSGKDVPCRIDMVAVVLDDQNKVERITHHENLM
ncbi:YraN family protein [Candidatus Collierbacteria bacterium]|nr:YraN family protein [Candidatus Collierbacteria bacterium]